MLHILCHTVIKNGASPTMIAAAYIRVSTEDQIEYSPDSQLKRILEYASHNDMHIPDEYVFIDEGISGRTADKRPAFQQMIALAKEKRSFEKILVWKFSRFARNRQDSIFYKSMLRKECGVEVISITEPLTKDPTSILVEALLEAMDEFYSINLAQEVRRGMQERFSRGKAITIAPFGYTMGENGLVPHPRQAVWAAKIFELYASGKNYKEIADYLNAHAVCTNRGNPFESRAVSYILHNPVYHGILRKRNRTYLTGANAGYDRNYQHTPMDYVKGTHPPIISEELWNHCQARMGKGEMDDAPSGIHSGDMMRDVSVDKRDAYYLKNLIFCNDCGCPLIQIQHGNAFQCSGYNHGTCKQSHYVRRSVLESLVLRTCKELLTPTSVVFLDSKLGTVHERNEILRMLPYRMEYSSVHRSICVKKINCISAIRRS